MNYRIQATINFDKIAIAKHKTSRIGRSKAILVGLGRMSGNRWRRRVLDARTERCFERTGQIA